ncbi:MAG TPA: TIGR00730 family Rossman fold protein [Bacteroidota bacterium]|nr:TIGR00730 family Rossman fold protein [Bacteroidota bacterium]
MHSDIFQDLYREYQSGDLVVPERSVHDKMQDEKLYRLMKAQKDIWRVFHMMSEFVDGFQLMMTMPPCVTIFGSARVKPGSPYYELTVEVAKAFAAVGYGVISGGGPGVMEAANKGAKEAGVASVGFNITLPFEQSSNQYIDPEKSMTFRHFFVRKVMFAKYAQGFIAMPGGFGTLDEFFEVVTLVQTKKIREFPIVLMGTEYWGGLVTWIKTRMVEDGMVSVNELDLITVTDDPAEAVRTIEQFYETKEHIPNF